MPHVAILGAGSIGASLAHRLSQRGRVADVLLIDENANAAAGKALDIRQAGPVERSDVRVSATGDPLAAAAADVIVLADAIGSGEWEGEPGLALVQRLVRAGAKAPLVFAGPRQLWLMEAAFREAKIDPARIVGTAGTALAGAVRALAALELNLASVDLVAVGRPPRLVVGWSAATAAGALLTDRVPAHRLRAISESLPRLWPPGPLALASATAPVVEALISGDRQLHVAARIVDGELGARGRAVVLPLELGRRRVLGHVLPSLSPQERTELMNAIEA